MSETPSSPERQPGDIFIPGIISSHTGEDIVAPIPVEPESLDEETLAALWATTSMLATLWSRQPLEFGDVKTAVLAMSATAKDTTAVPGQLPAAVTMSFKASEQVAIGAHDTQTITVEADGSTIDHALPTSLVVELLKAWPTEHPGLEDQPALIDMTSLVAVEIDLSDREI